MSSRRIPPEPGQVGPVITPYHSLWAQNCIQRKAAQGHLGKGLW
jgi:hypothetical protein